MVAFNQNESGEGETHLNIGETSHNDFITRKTIPSCSDSRFSPSVKRFDVDKIDKSVTNVARITEIDSEIEEVERVGDDLVVIRHIELVNRKIE